MLRGGGSSQPRSSGPGVCLGRPLCCAPTMTAAEEPPAGAFGAAGAKVGKSEIASSPGIAQQSPLAPRNDTDTTTLPSPQMTMTGRCLRGLLPAMLRRLRGAARGPSRCSVSRETPYPVPPQMLAIKCARDMYESPALLDMLWGWLAFGEGAGRAEVSASFVPGQKLIAEDSLTPYPGPPHFLHESRTGCGRYENGEGACKPKHIIGQRSAGHRRP